ncbi:MAG: hypothetical protein AAFX05_04280 [Planctomycetota bacterium]
MPNDLTPEQWEQVEAEIFAGRKIGAIKLFRELTGSDLRSAKEAVDAHERFLRTERPESFTASAKSGCAGAFLLAGALGILAVVI